MLNIFLLSIAALLSLSSSPLCAQPECRNRPPLEEIPNVTINLKHNWLKIDDVAQYKQADWSNLIGKASRVSVEAAKLIAEGDSRITYFFFVKGGQIVLENLTVTPQLWRLFRRGDAVFFSGEPWWGSAPGLADGYLKQELIQSADPQ